MTAAAALSALHLLGVLTFTLASGIALGYFMRPRFEADKNRRRNPAPAPLAIAAAPSEQEVV